MLKTLSIVAGLFVAFAAAGTASAQTCATWPYPLADGSTAYGSQVMANLNCTARLYSPQFTGNLGIGQVALSPLGVTGQVVIGQPYQGLASLQITQAYGGYGRLTEISPQGAYAPGLNLLAGNDGNGNQNWWAWGVTGNTWLINAGDSLNRTGFALDAGGNAAIGGGNFTVGGGGPGIVHLYGSTVYDTGDGLHLGGSGKTTEDGDLQVNGSTYAGAIAGRFGIGGAYQSHMMNFWWDSNCAYFFVDSTPFPVFCPSDRRLKNSIGALADGSGLATINKLRPVTYSWSKSGSVPHGVQYGFVAQEVQAVLPELVTNTGMKTPETPDGLLRLDYNGLLAPIVKAVQELKTLNDKQEAEIRAQAAEILKLKAEVVAQKGR